MRTTVSQTSISKNSDFLKNHRQIRLPDGSKDRSEGDVFNYTREAGPLLSYPVPLKMRDVDISEYDKGYDAQDSTRQIGV